MNKVRFDFEINTIKRFSVPMSKELDDINEKYEKGYSRVVTETGSYKVGLIKDVFLQDNYNLTPDYQRRITWDNKKRSKLIESLIINIPIPPIFLYEYDYDKYEVMDGLQRLTAIIDFYNNQYRLSGLEEWKELEGKKYKDLPNKIREGIDRRQLQVITLLKESAASEERADRIKRLVFERLNTGGVKLMPQEIRNAIYNGIGNEMCQSLSNTVLFKTLWEIPAEISVDETDYDLQDQIENEKLQKKLERNALYKRMYDVELVLRYFAMRHIDDFDYSLSEVLDDTLYALNQYSEENIKMLSDVFISALRKANALFGDKAFKYCNEEKWSSPARMIYDPMMMVLSQDDIIVNDTNVENNVVELQKFYNSATYIDDEGIEQRIFDGKHQSKEDIKKRAEALDEFIRSLIK